MWKHVPLCNFLINEKPRKYVESNSAFAEYTLNNTPAQQYGIYHLVNQAQFSPDLANLPFIRLVNEINPSPELTTYLGSPGLAMNLLENNVEEFIFFDLDEEALLNIENYASQLNLRSILNTHNEDSIEGIHNLIDTLSSDDFVFFDPYFAFEKNAHERDFFDVFIEATQKNIKCMLWYGFNNLVQKQLTKSLMDDAFEKMHVDIKKHHIRCIEILLSSISEQDPDYNPGIMACGLIISNLSRKSIQDFDKLSNLLVKSYQGIELKSNTMRGDLYKEIVF